MLVGRLAAVNIIEKVIARALASLTRAGAFLIVGADSTTSTIIDRGRGIDLITPYEEYGREGDHCKKLTHTIHL